MWLENAFYFSTGSLAAGNLNTNPHITMHLESGSEVVLIEGAVKTVRDPRLLSRVVSLYNSKYGWDLDPRDLGGPLYVMRPAIAFGWVSDDSGADHGSAFHGTATRWRFPAVPSTR